ncbi:DegT/DnrJ/EryC1/StrS family aminotransferase [soil metagenome]
MSASTKVKPVPMLDLSPQLNELWDEFNAATQRVLRSGQFVLGDEVGAFEAEVARYLGIKHAVGLNSGTDALVIGLRALGVGPGDEVVTTPFSFFATAEAISSVGATPVFVDVDETTFNLDPDKLEAAVTKRTKAILPVHLYGNPAAMTRILEVAEAYGLKVLEDCAQSFGARYWGAEFGSAETLTPAPALLGKHTGTLGDAGAFSFYPTKNLGAFGDAGMLLTDNDEVADLARLLRNHGSKVRYSNEMLGYNSRLDSLQAALLRVKLPHVERWNRQRVQAAKRYNALFAGLEGVVTPTVFEGHVFHQYTLRFIHANRDAVQAKLAEQGVSTAVYYPLPQDELPVYRGKFPVNPVSRRLGEQVLSLPLWPEIDSEVQGRVAEAVIGVSENRQLG